MKEMVTTETDFRAETIIAYQAASRQGHPCAGM